jgi:hypothetical protein
VCNRVQLPNIWPYAHKEIVPNLFFVFFSSSHVGTVPEGKLTTSWVTAGSGVPGSLLAGLLERCQILLAS